MNSRSCIFALLTLLVTAQSDVLAAGWLDVLFKKNEHPGAADAGTSRLYDASKALIIGMDNYEATGWPKLSMGVRDAEQIASALKYQGFEVTLLKDLKSDELERAFQDFFIEAGADENARLLVWYAGHGHTVKGEGYLVPVDAPDPKQDVKFRRAALSLRRFGEYMREARAKHVLAIFDSCFAGTVFSTSRSAAPAAITYATGQTVRQFITSGEAEQEVSDDGTFRRLFIDALRGDEPSADANQDGYITGAELGQFLYDKVTNYSNQRQTPRWGKLAALGYDRGDFVFKKQTTRSQADANTGKALGGSDDDVAKGAWSLVQSSNDIKVLKRFREQFGANDPRLDSLAADRIAALEKAANKTPTSHSTTSGPTHRPARSTTEISAEKSFVFSTMIGIPDAPKKRLLERMSLSMDKRGMRATAGRDAYSIEGYFGATEDPAGAKISFVWDVKDAYGKVIQRIKNAVISAKSDGCTTWGCLDDTAIEKIALITMS